MDMALMSVAVLSCEERIAIWASLDTSRSLSDDSAYGAWLASLVLSWSLGREYLREPYLASLASDARLTLLSIFNVGLQDGGPAGLIYGFLFCWIGYTAVVASLAELVSMIPTSGGQ